MKHLLYLYGEEITGTRAREIHTLHRCQSLAEAGASVHLIIAHSPRFPTNDALLQHFGHNPHPNWIITRLSRQWRLGSIRLTSSRYFYGNVKRWLKSHSHFSLAYVIHLKAAQFLQQQFPDLPTVFEAHEIFADAYPEDSRRFKTLEQQEQQVYARSAAVVATSRYLLEKLDRRHSLPQKKHITPNGIDESFFSVDSTGSKSNHLIYIGSFQPWKGVFTAIHAMRFLPDYHLTLVGGSSTEVKSHQKNAPANITFTGFLPKKKILPLLASPSIALLPNRHEPKNSLSTFPMKLLEYAAAGKRVVATDLPVIRELHPGSWLKIVPPDQPETLADAIRMQQQHPISSEKPRQWARQFLWSTCAHDLHQFLSSV